MFEPVRFVKLNAIASAALDFAKTGAEIALGLVGVLALFLGLLKIAEDSGIVFALVKLVRPILRPLFPEVPPDHPALGMIALNLTATRLRAGERGHAVRHQGHGGIAEAQPVGGHRHQLDGHAAGDQHGQACSSSRRCCCWRSWAPRSTR